MSDDNTGQSSGVTTGHRAWYVAASMLALVAAVYFQTFRDLWPLWTDTGGKTYTHGPLIVLLCLWLVWRARSDLVRIPVRPALWALPLLMLLSFTWLVLAKANILTLHSLLWPVLALSSVLAAAGWPVARRLAFAVCFLWFAVPIWDHINGLLQSGTVLAVHVLTVITRVPAEIHGNTVILPQGRFEIASGCSGLHFFMVGLAIAALAGEIHRDKLKLRLMLLALAAAIALVSNWLRVYVIILAGYLTDMQHYLVRVDHYKFGWAVFAVAMVGFFLVLRQLPASSARSAVDVAPIVPGATLPAGTLVAVAALLVLPISSWLAWQVAGKGDASRFDAVAVGGFSGPLTPSPAWQPEYLGPLGEFRAAYLAPSGRVLDSYGVAYVEQEQGKELVGYRNHLFDHRTFVERSRKNSFVETDVGPLPIVELRVDSRRGDSWLALYQYDIGGKTTASGLVAQLLSGFDSLWGPEAAGLRAVAAPCGGDCNAVHEELELLLAQLARKGR